MYKDAMQKQKKFIEWRYKLKEFCVCMFQILLNYLEAATNNFVSFKNDKFYNNGTKIINFKPFI